MSEGNGIKVDVIRLESRLNHTEEGLNKVQEDIKSLHELQNTTNLALVELNTTLQNTNQTLTDHKGIVEAARVQIQELALDQAASGGQFKVIVGILAAIGIAVLSVAVKLLFFFPS